MTSEYSLLLKMLKKQRPNMLWVDRQSTASYLLKKRECDKLKKPIIKKKNVVKKKVVKKKVVKKKVVKKKIVVEELVYKKVDVSKCTMRINKIIKRIYEGKGKSLSTYDTLFWDQLKEDKQLYSAITSNDFYSTPKRYGELIYKDVLKSLGRDSELQIIDVGTGLGSLILPFIINKENLNIKQITMIEQNEDFSKLLRCYEIDKRINVIIDDFFNIDLSKIIKYRYWVLITNPPFNIKRGKQFLKKNYYLSFIYKSIEEVKNQYENLVYVIAPKTYFSDYLHEVKIDDRVILEPKKYELKNIRKDLPYFQEEDLYLDFIYMGKVTGFKGITKMGKPRKSVDASLFKYGIV